MCISSRVSFAAATVGPPDRVEKARSGAGRSSLRLTMRALVTRHPALVTRVAATISIKTLTAPRTFNLLVFMQLNRTGFAGGLIQREDGAHGKTKQVSRRVA